LQPCQSPRLMLSPEACMVARTRGRHKPRKILVFFYGPGNTLAKKHGNWGSFWPAR